MYIAPEPGLINPITAFKKWRQHLAGILAVMAVLLLSFNGVQANNLSASLDGFHSPAAMPPGVPDLTNPNTIITIITTGAIADGISGNKVRVHIADSDGNGVPNISVNFFYNPGSGEVNIPVVTDVNGDAYFTLATSVVGNIDVTAKVGGVALPTSAGNPIPVTFIPNTPNVNVAETILSPGTDGAVANGSSTNCVKAHIANINGHPVPNEPVTFSVQSGTASPAGGTNIVNTDANGDVTICYNSTVVGTVNISAKVGGLTIVNGSPQPVHFVADVPSNSPFTKLQAVGAGTATADGIQTNCVKAIIADQYGHLLQGQPVQFAIQSGAASFAGSVSSGITDANGETTVCMNSLVAGDVKITATFGSTPTPIVTGSPATVTFIADVPDLTNPLSTFVINNGTALADGTDKNEVQVHLVDKNNNVVKNQDVVITIVTGVANEPTIRTVKTDNNGNAIVTYTSIVAGDVELKAEVNGSPVDVHRIIKFIPDAPSNASTKLVVIPPGTVAADDIQTNCVKAIVADKNGNLVAGVPVQFSIQTGTASFAGGVSTGITDANGEVTVCVKSKKAGDVEITATFGVTPVPITNGSPAKVTFAPDAANELYSAFFFEEDGIAKADGTDKNVVVAKVFDKNGNGVPNQDVIVTVISGITNLPIAVHTTTNYAGFASVPYTSYKAGDVILRADLGSVRIGGDLTVKFVADAPSNASGLTKLVVIPPGTVLADGIQTNCVKATLADKNNNLIAGALVTFTIKSGTASFVGGVSTGTTDVNGETTVCLNSIVSGDVEIIATFGSTPTTINNSPVTVTFTADAPDPTNPKNTFKVKDDGVATANGTDKNEVVAHIVDKNGNPVKNQDVVITIVSGTTDQQVTITIKTDNNGDATASYTSTVAGDVSLKAELNGSPVGTQQSVKFVPDAANPGNPSSFVDYIGDNSAAADGHDENIVYAHIVDANNNPVAGVDVTFVLTGPINATYIKQTDAFGNATLKIQSSSAGTVKIAATVNGVALKNSPLTVYFLVGPPDNTNSKTRLEVKDDGIAVADDVDLNIIVAHVHDHFDNPVPGQTVTIMIATGTATAISLTGVTDAKGEITFKLHSSIVGDVTVTAIINATTSITNGSPAAVKFTHDPDVTNPLTFIKTVDDNAIADGLIPNSVMAHVVDAAGNALVGKDVTFFISSGDPSAAITIPIATTDVNGEAKILITSKKPGFVNVMAIVDGDTIRFGSPAKVRFIAEDVYVPKVFTPNGDGTNDVLKPIIVGTFNFQFFNVYNRWGNLVFTTRDVNTGWDGRLKGVLQPIETYLWLVGGTDKDGKQMQKKGMTSLVR